ncbi:MAG: DUF4153 domain-containing protein [Tissierellia bacterium]|nr:DUF4153 domain-containing protein [Tissierellia bacterium]
MSLTGKIKEVFGSIKNSFKRFPITIGISTTLVIMLIILLEKRFQLTPSSRTVLQRVNMIIALGIPLSLCIKLVYEKREGLNRVHKTIGYILGTGILILYYFFLLKDFSTTSIIRYIGVSLFLYLAFSYIPWIDRKEDFEFYIIRVFSSFFLTIIYSAVLYFGISAILFATDQLFDVNIPGKFFYYSFLVVAGIFAPSLFLARIPEGNHSFDKYEYPRSLKILLLYIVIPLITIYSVILYAYFAKIIITRNWPRGLVSHLVLWYSFISVAVIFFITPILKENRWANRFKFWFPKLIIPILIMMFISIGTRIRTYGITENRYFVLVLGLWVFGIMLYFALRKKSKNIIIPITLSIISLNAVFGPLSSFAMSSRSQNDRLQSILRRNKMLVNNKIVKAPDNMFTDDKMEISMILKYFDTYHSLDDVKYLEKNFKVSDMESVFGFPYMEKDINESNYFNLFIEDRAIEITGYDYLLEGYKIVDGVKLKDNLVASYNMTNNKFNIKDDELVYEADLKDIGLGIIEKHGGNIANIENQNLLNMDQMIFIDENDKVKVKFMINSISGEKGNRPDEYIFENIDYYVLVKIK